MPIVTAKKITKTYVNGDITNRALKGVSLDVNEGDFLMITGRNGSGKSTFMHQLALLDSPTSGTITILGQDVTKLSEHNLTSMRLNKIGYVFQEYALIGELTALQNVMLPHMMIGSVKNDRKTAKKC